MTPPTKPAPVPNESDAMAPSFQQQLAKMTTEVPLVDAKIYLSVTSNRNNDILAPSHTQLLAALQQLINKVQKLLEICSPEPLPQPPQLHKIMLNTQIVPTPPDMTTPWVAKICLGLPTLPPSPALYTVQKPVMSYPALKYQQHPIIHPLHKLAHCKIHVLNNCSTKFHHCPS